MFPALASLVAIASENRKRWGVAGSIVVSLALLWPSKPGAGTAGENVYEIAFVTVSYLLLGLILYGLRRALPGEPPEAGGIAEG
jgi:hypothetical protein